MKHIKLFENWEGEDKISSPIIPGRFVLLGTYFNDEFDSFLVEFGRLVSERPEIARWSINRRTIWNAFVKPDDMFIIVKDVKKRSIIGIVLDTDFKIRHAVDDSDTHLKKTELEEMQDYILRNNRVSKIIGDKIKNMENNRLIELYLNNSKPIFYDEIIKRGITQEDVDTLSRIIKRMGNDKIDEIE